MQAIVFDFHWWGVYTRFQIKLIQCFSLILFRKPEGGPDRSRSRRSLSANSPPIPPSSEPLATSLCRSRRRNSQAATWDVIVCRGRWRSPPPNPYHLGRPLLTCKISFRTRQPTRTRRNPKRNWHKLKTAIRQLSYLSNVYIPIIATELNFEYNIMQLCCASFPCRNSAESASPTRRRRPAHRNEATGQSNRSGSVIQIEAEAGSVTTSRRLYYQ